MANSLKVVIAAAGTGSRMKSTVNKQYMLLKNKPVLYYSLEVFNHLDLIEEIIVVAQASEVSYCQNEIIDKYNFSKVTKVIAGGDHRQESVERGLHALGKGTELVAIHDGARPLITAEIILAVYQAAYEHGAAIPGVLVKDTVKTIDANGLVVNTLDRSSIMAIQTPQIFVYDKLVKAYELAKTDNYKGTDDASLYEKYIDKVKVVKSDYKNLKITTPEDLIIAEQLI